MTHPRGAAARVLNANAYINQIGARTRQSSMLIQSMRVATRVMWRCDGGDGERVEAPTCRHRADFRRRRPRARARVDGAVAVASRLASTTRPHGTQLTSPTDDGDPRRRRIEWMKLKRAVPAPPTHPLARCYDSLSSSSSTRTHMPSSSSASLASSSCWTARAPKWPIWTAHENRRRGLECERRAHETRSTQLRVVFTSASRCRSSRRQRPGSSLAN